MSKKKYFTADDVMAMIKGAIMVYVISEVSKEMDRIHKENRTKKHISKQTMQKKR